MDALEGLMESEVRAGAVTVKVDEPCTVPKVAVMVAVPNATQVANPVWTLMVATEVADEVQVTFVVRSCVVPLL